MKVEISDYGSDEKNNYYVVYKVIGLSQIDMKKLQTKVEGNVNFNNDEMIITTYFEEKYFPFGSEAAHCRIEDFIAREEIEMTLYLTSILEDE
jgi:hypothetical protein